jgi:predicted DNA-binding transcriptional regulator AlpA
VAFFRLARKGGNAIDAACFHDVRKTGNRPAIRKTLLFRDVTPQEHRLNFIRIKNAAASAGVSIPTIYRWANTDPDFSPLVKLGEGTTVLEKEIFDDFIRKRVERAISEKAQRLARHAGVPA